MSKRKETVTNFGRFYSAIRAFSFIDNGEDFKRQIVRQYTNGRTDSLREMTRLEYDRCCDALEGHSRYKETLRKERSATLKLMQKAGIDTTDWNRVNRFCLDPRIAGKEFARITAEEHPQLRRKLRAIDSKGGFAIAAGKREHRESKAKTTSRFSLIEIPNQPHPELN